MLPRLALLSLLCVSCASAVRPLPPPPLAPSVKLAAVTPPPAAGPPLVTRAIETFPHDRAFVVRALLRAFQRPGSGRLQLEAQLPEMNLVRACRWSTVVATPPACVTAQLSDAIAAAGSTTLVLDGGGQEVEGELTLLREAMSKDTGAPPRRVGVLACKDATLESFSGPDEECFFGLADHGEEGNVGYRVLYDARPTDDGASFEEPNASIMLDGLHVTTRPDVGRDFSLIEIADDVGWPFSDHVVVAPTWARIDGTPRFPADLTQVVARLRTVFGAFVATRQAEVSTTVAKARASIFMPGMVENVPRTTVDDLVVTWLPESEHVRVVLHRRLRGARRVQVGCGPPGPQVCWDRFEFGADLKATYEVDGKGAITSTKPEPIVPYAQVPIPRP